MKTLLNLGALTLAAVVLLAAPATAEELKAYEPVSGVSGSLSSKGSDTLGNLMNFWAEDFRKLYPNVNIQIESKGSGTAPEAMIQGTAELGPMSRPMKSDEIAKFEEKYGYKPTEIAVAIDCLAVYVNKDNPVHALSFDQIDSMFSSTRKRGYADVSKWGQVGLEGEWTILPMAMYGRNSASGTNQYFKEHALQKGDFKNSVKVQPGSAAVVNAVANDRAGVGYSGIGYKAPGVRAVPLCENADKKPVEPSFENALNGSYPLARQLLIYVNKKPNEPPSQLVSEFIKFVLSKQGQEIVVKDGYGALPPAVARKQVQKLD